MKRPNKKEQGQVLVLLTFGMITLLGFTALAIDLGRLYSEKRTIQGVADSSSLTGALYIGQYEGTVTSAVEQTAINTAEGRAASNGYTQNVTVTVDKISPFYIVTTEIESTIPPTIAQLVYNGPLSVKVKSVARVYRVTEFAFGNALYAMSNDKNRAIEFSGNGFSVVTGTGIYSNSSASDSIIFIGGSDSTFSDPMTAAGGITVQNNAEVSNETDGTTFTDFLDGADALGAMYVPTPTCAGLPLGVKKTTGPHEITYSPGIYSDIKGTNGATTYIFEKGFYCIEGSLTTLNGTFIGDQVSFYVKNGNVNLGGNVDFRAPRDGTVVDGGGQNWNGMLLHIANGVLTINGNADSYYEGTIYVPNDAQSPACKLNGESSSDGYNVQLVCDTIQVNGTGDLVIHFDDSVSYIPPVEIDLWE